MEEDEAPLKVDEELLPIRNIYCSKCIGSVLQIAGDPLPHLTDRQRQCLEGFITRKTAKEIGRELGITHHAVEQHLKAARKKLGATDTLDAARRYAAKLTTTGEPYYASSEVSPGTFDEHSLSQPKRGVSRLWDVATDGPGTLQALSATQTLIAVGICGLGMIAILALIVAVANGVAQLAS